MPIPRTVTEPLSIAFLNRLLDQWEYVPIYYMTVPQINIL